MIFKFSKSALDKVGEKLRHSQKLSYEEEKIFEEFRVGHSNIIKYYKEVFEKRMKKNKYRNRNIIFASRLKRRDTIINKLSDRFSQMSLTRMHDIAGARLIFPDIETLTDFRNEFLASQQNNREYHRIKEDKYNYIDTPNSKTGYRGYHCIFEETNGKIKAKLEIQFRTEVQHAWSTACEIWDANFNDQTKFGLASSNDVTLFFKYISEFFVRFVENKKDNRHIIIPSSLQISDQDLFEKIIEIESKSKILQKLKKIPKIETTDKDNLLSEINEFYLLLSKTMHSKKPSELDIKAAKILEKAIKKYSNKERTNENNKTDTVLVYTKKPEEAYNNYYNNISLFMNYYNIAKQNFKKKYLLNYIIIRCKYLL